MENEKPEEEYKIARLMEGGWNRAEDGIHWHHEVFGELYDTNQATEILRSQQLFKRLLSERNALAETVERVNWGVDEPRIRYAISTRPFGLLLELRTASSLKELREMLFLSFGDLSMIEKKPGTLLFSLIKKVYEKVVLPNGEAELTISEVFINNLYLWTGEEWTTIHGIPHYMII
jgi:hypothetical protein